MNKQQMQKHKHHLGRIVAQHSAYMCDVLRHDQQKIQCAVVHEAAKQLAAHPVAVTATGGCTAIGASRHVFAAQTVETGRGAETRT